MPRISLDPPKTLSYRVGARSALGLTSQGFKDRCEVPAAGAGTAAGRDAG